MYKRFGVDLKKGEIIMGLDLVLPGLSDEIANAVFEVEFILEGTNLRYPGQGEFRINGFYEKGTEGLSITYLSKLDLSQMADDILSYLKSQLTLYNHRIIDYTVFDSYISDLCDCISKKSDYYCFGGRQSINGISLSYIFVLMNKQLYYDYFKDEYSIYENGIKRFLVIDLLIKNSKESNMTVLAAEEIMRLYQLPTVKEIIEYSELHYEGAENNSTLVFGNSSECYKSKSIIFQSVIELSLNNKRQVRKIMEMSDANHALLVEDKKIKALSYIDDDMFDCMIKFHGDKNWSLFIDKKLIFSSKKNQILFTHVKNTNTYLMKLLKLQFPDLKKQEYERIEDVVKIACTQKHGTSIIVFKDAIVESQRLCKLRRGIMIEKVNLHENLEFIRHITSIDGAVFMDSNCNCVAIGIIVDGKSVMIGDSSRGARYNSIYNYIALKSIENIACLGIIISEDGMIDMVSSDCLKNNLSTKISSENN